LNDVVKATSRESGSRDKKVVKLRAFLNETSKHSALSTIQSSSLSSIDLVNFNVPIPLIIDPSVRAVGINVDKATMFISNLMPCKFVFKVQNEQQQYPTSSQDQNEYSVIYKIGDDLRQDQLVLQMIALMDKVKNKSSRKFEPF
jgi:phosphatidylinositol 3-kinase